VRAFVQSFHTGDEQTFCSLLSSRERKGHSVSQCASGPGFKALASFPTGASVHLGAHRLSGGKAEYLITGPGGFKAAVVLIHENARWVVDKFVRG
jgi:hypothetical protein